MSVGEATLTEELDTKAVTVTGPSLSLSLSLSLSQFLSIYVYYPITTIEGL